MVGVFLIAKKNNDCETEIPVYIVQSLARCIITEIIAFYKSKEGQAYFEKWKAEQSDNNK